MASVTVIVPYYNDERFIYKCLESIKNQTTKPSEVILVDDGSDGDPTELKKKLEEYGFLYMRHERNLGISAARQSGVNFAQGEWISFLSSDDEWQPDFLEKMLGFMEAYGNRNAVYFCNYRNMDVDGNPLNTFKIPQFEDDSQMRVAIVEWAKKNDLFVNFDCLLIPSQLFEKISFMTGLRRAEDLDWVLRAMLVKKIRFKFVPSILVNYRRVEKHNTKEHMEGIVKANEETFERINAMLGKKVF